jgi:hypothetical protein
LLQNSDNDLNLWNVEYQWWPQKRGLSDDFIHAKIDYQGTNGLH